MPLHFNPEQPHFRIRLLGSEEDFPSLLDISSFLYDFNLLSEISRLATDPKYSDFRFSNYALFRKGRPLEAHDRLHIEELRQGSPLVVVTVVAIVGGVMGAVWGTVQIVEKIVNAPLNRRKLRAEVEKLERENRESLLSPTHAIFEDPEQLRKTLRIREAESYYDNVGGRLERSSVRIKEFEIEVVERKQLRKPQ